MQLLNNTVGITLNVTCNNILFESSFLFGSRTFKYEYVNRYRYCIDVEVEQIKLFYLDFLGIPGCKIKNPLPLILCQSCDSFYPILLMAFL